MKSVVVISCIILIVGLIAHSSLGLPAPATKGNCAFGQEFNDGCNHCVCHGNSGSTCSRLPNCTLDTTRAIPVSPTMEKIYNAMRRGHCSLGLEFQKDCNVCTCQGEQGYICTKKECSTSYKIMGDAKNGVVADVPESPTPPSTTMEPGRCILGHRFFNGCSLCVCYGEYFGYRCARMENCREQRMPEIMSTTMMPMMHEKQTGSSCPQGESYHDGYYKCKCRTDRKGYVCTIGIS